MDTAKTDSTLPTTAKDDDGAVSTGTITTDDQTNAMERRQNGEFVRGVSTARNWITTDDAPMYPLAKDRYHDGDSIPTTRQVFTFISFVSSGTGRYHQYYE